MTHTVGKNTCAHSSDLFGADLISNRASASASKPESKPTDLKSDCERNKNESRKIVTRLDDPRYLPTLPEPAGTSLRIESGLITVFQQASRCSLYSARRAIAAGEYDVAIRLTESAANIRIGNTLMSEVYCVRALAHQLAGQRDQALGWYEKALLLNPGSREASSAHEAIANDVTKKLS